MGVLNNNYIKGFIILMMVLPLASNCSKCKTFKKNVNVCKMLTACSLLINNNATIYGDLTVNGVINGAGNCAGPVGPVGPKGDTGLPGNQGDPGSAGQAVPVAYGYFYNTTNVAVGVNANVLFNTNGPLASVTHSTVTNTDRVYVTNAGTYAIRWTFSIGEITATHQFELRVNDSALVPNLTSYTLPSDGGQYNGQCILTLAAGDFITLRNTSGVVKTPFGTAVTASIMIRRLL